MIVADEQIVLVDESNNEIGIAPKLASHHKSTPLHRAFSCYIFDQSGNFLMTRRALSKKVFPGIWTNSLCGHPAPGESFEEAVVRRAGFELGTTVSKIRPILPKFRYKADMAGIVENEFCPVFQATLNGELAPNPAEVEDIKWVTWADYVDRIQTRPTSLSPWSVLQVNEILAQSIDLPCPVD